MGFRDLISFNKAILAKQIWKIIKKPDSLVARTLKAGYFKHSDIMDATLGSNPTYIWRSLLWSRDIIEKGIIWNVGNGEIINARKNRWIPRLKAGVISSNVFESNVCIK